MPYFQFENFRMHYETVRGAVPTDTLLIHGNLASNLSWQPAVESWRKIQQRESQPERPWQGLLILAEWRGCGKSSGPSSESDMDFGVLANDYIELLASLGVESANVVGHGTGAMIALQAMLRAPELFRRSVLLNPVSARGLKVTPEMQQAFLQMSRDRESVKWILKQKSCLEESPFLEQIVDQALATHPLVWAHILNKLAGADLSSQVSLVKHPVLVLHGSRDPIQPQEGAEELAGLLPEGRFQLIEHHGHACHLENPALFVEITHRYLFG